MTDIRLVQGDITRIEVDAIINAANSALAGGGGVDGAIHRVGGPAVMADLESRYGPDRHCPTGSAVVSDAGEAESLANAYRTSLDLAAREGARSVAFPSISTGIYGYPVDLAAAVALQTVDAWLAEHPDALEAVTFVLFSTDSLEAFERASRS
jgi:O-acetyl-ADP-ribose deacetylase (regulator of RNase III)